MLWGVQGVMSMYLNKIKEDDFENTVILIKESLTFFLRTSKMTTLSLPLPPIAENEDANESTIIYPSSTLSASLKEQLQTKVTHYALIIPAKFTATLRQQLKNVLMQRPKMKAVYPILEHDILQGVHPKMERKLVLSCVVCGDDDTDDTDDKNNDEDSIYSHELIKPLLQKNVKNTECNNNIISNDDDESCGNIRKSTHTIVIGYDHYNVEQALSKILPRQLCNEIPSSFEVIGNIAHLNLRPEYIPFKYIIGRVILDKNKSIQVCVNKTGTIQNEFRTFPMEILADDRPKRNSNNTTNNNKRSKSEEDDHPKLEVEVKEDGCKFKLDFEKVYWNSRLQFEHRRIVNLIGGECRQTNVQQRKRNETKRQPVTEAKTYKQKVIVADACAGIGPFSVPLSSQYDHVQVYANDLNPISYKYLNINAQGNKCRNIKAFNMDARYFLRKLDDEGIVYDHVLMNLPAIAPEFLNVFRGWTQQCDDRRPMIHVHCFGGKGDDADDEAIARCSKSLGCKMNKEVDEISVHIVRDVSPQKNMLCVSFRLPMGVKDLERIDEFGSVTKDENEAADDRCNNRKDEEPSLKKPRTSNHDTK